MRYKDRYNTKFYEIAYQAIEDGDVTRSYIEDLVRDRDYDTFGNEAFEIVMESYCGGGDPMETREGEELINQKVYDMGDEMIEELLVTCHDLDFIEEVVKELGK